MHVLVTRVTPTHPGSFSLTHARMCVKRPDSYQAYGKRCALPFSKFHIPALAGWQRGTFPQPDKQLKTISNKTKRKERSMIGFIRTFIKQDKEEDSFCVCLGLPPPQHKHQQPSETQDLFWFCCLIMFMTQQEASGPSPAGRKPEQLLPETFGSTFH